MFHVLVVAVHEADDIFLVEFLYYYTFTVIERIYVGCVLNYQQPFRSATGTQIVGQAFLVILCELVLCIGGKFAIISPLLTFAFIALAY